MIYDQVPATFPDASHDVGLRQMYSRLVSEVCQKFCELAVDAALFIVTQNDILIVLK